MLSTYFPGGFLKSTKLCAGTEQGDMDVCSGDSGGPMVLQQKDGSFVLVGVVSLGLYDCGVPGIPSIYSRVSAYLQWIAGVIRGSSRAAELIRALLTKSQVPTAGSPAQRYTPGNNAIQLPLQRAKSGDFRSHAQSARKQTAAKGAGSKDRTSEFRAYVEYILGKTGNLPHRSRVISRHGEAASATRESIRGAAYQSPKDHTYGKTDTLQGSRAKSQGEQTVAAASSSIGDGHGKTGITSQGSLVKSQGDTVGAASGSIGDGYLSSKGHINGKRSIPFQGSRVKSQGETVGTASGSIGDGYRSSKGHINGKRSIPFQGSRVKSQGETVGAASGSIGDGFRSSKRHANGKIDATAEGSRLKSHREGAVGAAGASLETGHLSPKDPVNGITSHESQAKVSSGQAGGIAVADEADIHRSLTTSSQAQQKRSGALGADHSLETKHASRKLYSPREALAGSSVIRDQRIGLVDNRDVALAEQVGIGWQQGIATKEPGSVSLRQKIETSIDDPKVQDREATVSGLATDGNAGTRVGATELDKSSSVKTSVGQASQNKPASILQHKVGSTSQTRDGPKFQPKTTPTAQPAVIPTSPPTRYPSPPPSPSPTKPAEQKTWQELLKDVMKE
ncbi:uncharacterized protein LOC122390899 [Amphibalanus amphitrite]|uniref:uncharacterized protein LOC122390899 n=1 Tax=Amphibalanus amphitrite TaxID=1232801 RepID=UPI001C919041|nr:uncharacterized protein LOC122390899 [Amphibalanus amphitrite]